MRRPIEVLDCLFTIQQILNHLQTNGYSVDGLKVR